MKRLELNPDRRRQAPASRPGSAAGQARVGRYRLAPLEEDLLGLQATAGNAAVGGLLDQAGSRTTKGGAALPLQRTLMSRKDLSEAAGGYAGGKHRKGRWVLIGNQVEEYNEFIKQLGPINTLRRPDQEEALKRLRGIDDLIDKWLKRHGSGKLPQARSALDLLRYQSGVEQLQIEKRGHGPVGHQYVGILERPMSPANPRRVPPGGVRFLGAQGWKLHISFHPGDIKKVNDGVLPFLAQSRFGHKLIEDVRLLKDAQVGKMLVVYPIDESTHVHTVKGATVVDKMSTTTCDVSIVVVDRGSAAAAAEAIAGLMRKAGVRTGVPVPDDQEQFNEYTWGRYGAFGAEDMYDIQGTTYTSTRDPTRAKEGL